MFEVDLTESPEVAENQLHKASFLDVKIQVPLVLDIVMHVYSRFLLMKRTLAVGKNYVFFFK